MVNSVQAIKSVGLGDIHGRDRTMQNRSRLPQVIMFRVSASTLDMAPMLVIWITGQIQHWYDYKCELANAHMLSTILSLTWVLR